VVWQRILSGPLWCVSVTLSGIRLKFEIKKSKRLNNFDNIKMHVMTVWGGRGGIVH